MAEITSEVRNGRLRSTIHIAPGERVSLCRCFKSKEFPICDGTHKTMEGEYGPVVVDCPLSEPPAPHVA